MFQIKHEPAESIIAAGDLSTSIQPTGRSGEVAAHLLANRWPVWRPDGGWLRAGCLSSRLSAPIEPTVGRGQIAAKDEPRRASEHEWGHQLERALSSLCLQQCARCSPSARYLSALRLSSGPNFNSIKRLECSSGAICPARRAQHEGAHFKRLSVSSCFRPLSGRAQVGRLLCSLQSIAEEEVEARPHRSARRTELLLALIWSSFKTDLKAA